MEKHTIHVSHLSKHTSEYDLEDFFSNEFSNIEQVKIAVDHISRNEPRGIGYVQVSVAGISELQDGINKLHKQSLSGSVVYVNYFKVLDDNAQHLWDNHHYPGGRSRSHYRDYGHFRDEYRTHYGHYHNW